MWGNSGLVLVLTMDLWLDSEESDVEEEEDEEEDDVLCGGSDGAAVTCRQNPAAP